MEESILFYKDVNPSLFILIKLYFSPNFKIQEENLQSFANFSFYSKNKPIFE